MLERTMPMANKICMITGATSGIGAVAARSLARKGAAVILIGRNSKKCADTAQWIKHESKNTMVEYIVADLSLQKEVRRCAEQFKRNHKRLDVLINNAGARFRSRLQTAEGFEMTLALNYLGPFLLTYLLLDELRSSGRGRIINVASGAHGSCRGMNFDDLQGCRNFNGKEAYAQSKLAIILMTNEMARRLEGTTITANALEPGNVLTNFARNDGMINWARHIVGSLKGGGLVGPETGAKTSIHLASSPDVEGVSGQYFSRMRAVRSSEPSHNVEAAKRLWQVSLELTGLADTTTA